MMKRIFILGLIFLLSACGCTRSWAEIFRYQDPVSEFTMNYPDRWGVIHNQNSDDLVTITAPNADDFAICRIRHRKDNRFSVLSDRLESAVQEVHYGEEFWNNYVNAYNEPILLSIKNGAGLGNGFSGVAEVSYRGDVGYQGVNHALMAVTPYNTDVFIFECSAREEAFAKWYPAFTNIMRSVSFKKLNYDHPNGEYRDFISEGDVMIKGRKIQDTYHQ